jgi:hypothetical protein
MTEFPSNSQRPRKAIRTEPIVEPADRPEIKRVVEGEVVLRKKSLGKRFRETFVGGDGMTVREYVIGDILIPALRDLVSDITIGGIERMLYGDRVPAGRRMGRPGLPGGGGVRYDLAARNAIGRREDPRPPVSRRARASQDFSEEVVFESRVDAEAVLTGMYDILEQYNEVKLSDFFELVGRSSNYVDERYGWTDLFGSRPVRTRSGWLLDLPRTVQLER